MSVLGSQPFKWPTEHDSVNAHRAIGETDPSVGRPRQAQALARP